MTPESYRRAQALFEAVEPLSPELRAHELEAQCPDDAELRDLVLELLQQQPSHLARLRAAIHGGHDPGTTLWAGPYRLEQLLGEGGMGEVWLASQESPVRRKVALKLIRPGLGTREILARFEAERQAIAMMDHPAIAHAYDAGLTEAGLPYFAMEYCPGPPITEYCDSRRLSLKDRIGLFVQVCEGVHHAHQKAVLHRDLKPGNIIVMELDEHPCVKIIDFGIAKALNEPLVATGLQTRCEVLVGTPEYTSPERLAASAKANDVRSDVYSLGMLLYELTAGMLPFESGHLDGSDRAKMLREIERRCSLAPSSLLAKARMAPEIARHRRISPAALLAALKHDLDWVLLKAVAPEMGRRYPSALDLAADLRHYLQHRPVTARPPSRAYRTSRFVRRNRPAVLAAFLVVLALAAGFAGTLAGLVQAREAESKAQREAHAAEQSLQFLVRMFAESNPMRPGGSKLTVHELLEDSEQALNEPDINDPVLRAKLMQALARAYWGITDLEATRRLLQQTLDLQLATRGHNPLDVLRSKRYLAELYWAVGPLGEAERLARESLLGFQSVAGPHDPETMAATASLIRVLDRLGRYDEAAALSQDLLEWQRQALGVDSLEAAETMDMLASIRFRQGDLDSSFALFSEALSIQSARLGPRHLITLQSELGLANIAAQRGDLDRAEHTVRTALGIIVDAWGEASKPSYRLHEQLGIVLGRQGRWKEAESELTMALSGYRQILAPGHPDILTTALWMSRVYAGLGRQAQSRELAGEACAGRRTALGPEHPLTLEACTGFDELEASGVLATAHPH